MIQETLIEALVCDNEQIVIEGFMERYAVTEEEALDIFKETKKWLWLSTQVDKNDTTLFIDQPLLIIDEMWHNFILHTKQYCQFCITNFKRFIHHSPTSKKEKIAQQNSFLENPSVAIKEHEEKLAMQYSLIYDKLGAETLLKWYDTMAEKYTPDYIKSIKRY